MCDQLAKQRLNADFATKHCLVYLRTMSKHGMFPIIRRALWNTETGKRSADGMIDLSGLV